MLTAENSELGRMPIIDRNSASAEGSGGEPSKVISIELIRRPSYSSNIELAWAVEPTTSKVATTAVIRTERSVVLHKKTERSVVLHKKTERSVVLHKK